MERVDDITLTRLTWVAADCKDRTVFSLTNANLQKVYTIQLV